MPLISIMILTKNRSELLEKALASVFSQTLKDFEVVVVNDGSSDNTQEILSQWSSKFPLLVINHSEPQGITKSRQEALEKARGMFVATLDDDDEWVDEKKLEKQAGYFSEHPEAVLVGGGIELAQNPKSEIQKFRPQYDSQIRKTMLLRNNFFTSTVMFRRDIALKVGGFIKDEDDLAEDYDLWLRVGRIGRMYNFPYVFARYRVPSYNKDKFKKFLAKQLRLIQKHKSNYSGYWLAALILKLRIIIGR